VKTWTARIVLFILGFCISGIVLVAYWSASGTFPEQAWACAIAIAFTTACGALSARYGRRFWSVFGQSL